MGPRGFVAGAVMAAVALSTVACGTPSSRTTAGDGEVSDCEELSAETADLVVAAADHAASSGGGLPAAAMNADHPGDIDAWELTTALAGDSSDLQARVRAARAAEERLGCAPGPLHAGVDATVQDELAERGQLLAEEFDREQHTAMNLMAIVATTFQPPPAPAAEVPPGFPAEFPVHPDAEQVDADRGDDESVSATWQVEERFAVVADFYLDALQEGRLGGWDASSTGHSETQSVEGEPTGQGRFTVTGYGFDGEVTVIGDNPGHVTVTATLRPEP